MSILALDPGPEQTGWATLTFDGRILSFGIDSNNVMLERLLTRHRDSPVLAIEMIASYGMAVGAEVFDTCVWIGRFKQAWFRPEKVLQIFRKDVKMHLCGSNKAKDANVRQALIDMFGPPGRPKKPGPTFGINSHIWPALGVAVYVKHMLGEGQFEGMRTFRMGDSGELIETTRNLGKRSASDGQSRRRVPLGAVPVAGKGAGRRERKVARPPR